MGQLEKYGLYVLCLLIFLIAGVSIWGSTEQPGVPPSKPPLKAPASVDPAKPQPPRELGGGSNGTNTAESLDTFFQPVSQPGTGPGKKPTGDKNGAGSTPVSGGGTGHEPGSNAATPNPPVPAQPVTAQPVTPQPATKATYVVKAGDSFESIARTQLGDARRSKEIAQLNPSVKPERMAIGVSLQLPSPVKAAPAAAEKGAKEAKDAVAAADGSRLYAIKKGDTFERVARTELGTSKRVGEIKDLNPTVDPTKLQLGQKIKLPAK